MNPRTIACAVLVVFCVGHVSAASTLLDKIREDSDLSQVSQSHLFHSLITIYFGLLRAHFNDIRLIDAIYDLIAI